MFHTDGVLTDDTTILAFDVLPPGATDFRHLAKQVRKSTRRKVHSWKDILSILTYPLQDGSQEPLSLYTDIDVYTHYPRITSRGVAMYRMNKERYCALWVPPKAVHPVRYDSTMVDLMNDLQLEDGGRCLSEPAEGLIEQDGVAGGRMEARVGKDGGKVKVGRRP
ncbi:unnamed protein product [Ostreobium quekettii]|uniref:Uncharacterized protein n=1 Tax=Ostreobium quekettii TaxID=121088 RepID=A0A8S1J276_9CHLO|nr:unnamed protein product [Ostreobium quekettii]